MRVRSLVVFLSVLLLLGGPVSDTAEAQKGGSSGRSFSSGRSSSSSSSRSSSSGSKSSSSSSSGRSSFGGGSTSGKSYASGSSAPRPSTPSPSSGSAGTKPSGGTFDRSAGQAQSKQDSRSAFTGRTTAPSGLSPGTPSRTPQASPGGKQYSSGSAARPGGTAGQKPSGKSYYDGPASTAQRKEESRAAFTRGQQPQSSYTDSRGQTYKLDPKDRQIEVLREQLDHERWRNREYRQREFYRGYWDRPIVVYRDPYSSWFWWWLLAQSLDTRAYWVYHHRSAMDDARYRELLARDRELEARLKALEVQGVKRDPAYAPQGLDRDLMYTDAYVDAVYNPQPLPQVPATHPVARPHRSAWKGFTTVCIIAGVLAFLIWLVFFKRWGASKS